MDIFEALENLDAEKRKQACQVIDKTLYYARDKIKTLWSVTSDTFVKRNLLAIEACLDPAKNPKLRAALDGDAYSDSE